MDCIYFYVSQININVAVMTGDKNDISGNEHPFIKSV